MLVSVTESIRIEAPPEIVFDFTQDWTARARWDASVLEARVLAGTPLPRVAVRLAGGTSGVFAYRLFERPRRTSVALLEVRSALLDGGGGSWSYAAHEDGTLWTVTNSLHLRSPIVGWILAPFVRVALRRGTRAALAAAKAAIERARA